MLTVKATQFRKEVFNLLDSVLRGEEVDVTYKGQSVHLVTDKTPHKMTRLARLKANPLLVETSDTLLDDMAQTAAELDSAWEKKWDERLK